MNTPEWHNAQQHWMMEQMVADERDHQEWLDEAYGSIDEIITGCEGEDWDIA